MALLAIVVTLYVLAVSLLGRAITLSVEEQTNAKQKRKEDTENEINRIQRKLDKAKEKGKLDTTELTNSL